MSTETIPTTRADEADTATIEEFCAMSHCAPGNAEDRTPWNHRQVVEWAAELRRRNQENAR